MLNYKKILFTGGSGRFGKTFKNIHGFKNYIYPSSKEFNILKFNSIKNYLKKKKTDLVVHCAGLSRPMKIHDEDIVKSIDLNIIGTCNLVKACSQLKIKIIYFSTCYVYPGLKGDYKEQDPLFPANNYAWSKLGGEAAVILYKNSLILRISMTEKPFIHKSAFKNFITNFIFHDEVAKFLPKLFKYKGIINIGGPSQSPYKFAKKYNPQIKGIFIKKTNNKKRLINFSMNIKKLKRIISD
ncbi:sugar nucleotide-binding protein [Candidatus Pelagibacter sp.]|nr:sugar nucleotide-binding protein [Candidatus Pelagibacter sp.]